MTDQELKDLTASNAVFIEKLGKEIGDLKKTQELTFKEIREMQEETSKQLDRTIKKLDWMWVTHEKAEKRFEKTERLLDRTIKKLDWMWVTHEKAEKRLEKTEKLLDKTIRELRWMWVTQWEITEEIIYWWFENIMRKRWKLLKKVQRNVQIPWKIEIDILWVNWNEVFVTEVKTRLNKTHIDKFVNKWLVKFRKYFPEYWNYKLYWVMWWRSVPEKSKIYAEKQGLLLIQEDAKWRTKIINTKNFKPVEFLKS